MKAAIPVVRLALAHAMATQQVLAVRAAQSAARLRLTVNRVAALAMAHIFLPPPIHVAHAVQRGIRI